VVLDALLCFVGPPDVPRPLGQLAHEGSVGQEHDTACRLRLAGEDLRPLVQGDLQALPQRFAHPWRLGARPPRAIRGARLAFSGHRMLGALQRPPLYRGGGGIRRTAILLSDRLGPGGFQRRVGRLERPLQGLLPSVLLTAGVDPHGPIGLPV
jgi:hypothetical protein